MNRWIYLLLTVFFISNINAQQIAIQVDGEFGDWQALSPNHLDVLGDGRDGIDFRQLFITNDPDYLFLQFNIGTELNIQDDNSITVYLDIDDDPNTGLSSNGIGAELRYTFGSRSGRYQHNGNQTLSIEHQEIGLVALPSVTSDIFEFAIKRSGVISGIPYTMGDQIKVVIRDVVGGGDILPNNGGVSFTFDNTPAATADYSFTKAEDDFRIMSYNSEFDGFFENGSRDQQQNMVRAVNPDILAFQEIYDFSSAQVVNVVNNLIDGPLYHAKRVPDVHCISRYPIIDQSSINGNGAFLLDLGEKEVLLINTHYPCCGNDDDRQDEIDNVMKFVRESKANENFVPIKDETPILIVGDMNLVGFAQQLETMISGDIQNNNGFGPDFAPDWDGSNLKDALPLVTGLPLAYTYEDEDSSFGPGRIDLVLYTGSVLRKTNGFVLKTETMNEADRLQSGLASNDSQGSDHLPVIVDFSLDISVSNNEVEKAEIRSVVYPQPASDRLFFKTHLPVQEVELLDLNGRTVIQKAQFDSSSGLSLQGISSGTYVVVLNLGESSVYEKVVVVK